MHFASASYLPSFSISDRTRREKCQNTCFILEKRKKSNFNRLQIEVPFLPNISPLHLIKAHQIYQLEKRTTTKLQQIHVYFFVELSPCFIKA